MEDWLYMLTYFMVGCFVTVYISSLVVDFPITMIKLGNIKIQTSDLWSNPISNISRY